MHSTRFLRILATDLRHSLSKFSLNHGVSGNHENKKSSQARNSIHRTASIW